jgi:hypothetical protein
MLIGIRGAATCRATFALPLLLMAGLCGPLSAGTLDQVETEVAKAAPDTTDRAEEPESGDWSDWVDPVIDVGAAAMWGGVRSWMRMNPTLADTLEIEPREPGDLQIPLVSLDVRYQDVESDVSALDGRAEVGYGPLGLAFRYTHYTEEKPADELDIYQWHGLYRMSFTEWAEVDIGYGAMTLSGDATRSGGSLTAPLRVAFGDPAAVAFRPTWSWIGDRALPDYDVGLLWSWRYASMCLGYRWFECGEARLSGAFVGLSARL